MARILIAEDSPDIRALIQMLLEAEGHRVTCVEDGRAAVDAARDERPELILMDLSLPILSGWEAARQIRTDPATASIPILAVTAHAMHGDRERALAAGCDGFIAKPISEDTFASRVIGFINSRKAASGEASERREPSGSEPGRILVVDDQADVGQLLKTDLEADGHSVMLATSAAQALSQFEADDRFELAVIDVMLGANSGYDLTKTLTSQSAEYIPVLLVTAGTIDRERGYAAGADDFIGKPIETVELRARARSLIRVGRAIREQRRVGRERSEAYRKLEELDRMKSDFLSTVSHELRTPLNTIILLAHQLERGSGGSNGASQRDRDVRLLREAAEALRQMINNILDLAKLEAGQRDLHPERVAVRDLLQETANLLEPQAREKGLELKVEADSQLPETVHLDREKVSRVLVNLLSNAVKYTRSGSVVLRASPWQGSLTFEVRDTGSGIPADLVAKAFEPFQQIRTRMGEAPRGTGLGLSISKQLVEVMGGDLILESKEGHGTSVRFTLPDLPASEAGAEPSEAMAEALPRSPSADGHRVRVLIVEDDGSSRYGLAALLQSEGYDVAQAADLKQTDAILDRSTPDVIVLDITLPDGDGAEWLTQRTKRGAACPPVIALTGVTADEDTGRIQEAGVRRVLTKPVNVAQLLSALRDVRSTKL
jgi:DNA-binding response OmpR family regulator/anti-sigma regulatory factor (Ser/Thr protein kinase)